MDDCKTFKTVTQKVINIVKDSESLQGFKQASNQVRFGDSKSCSGGNVEKTEPLSVTKPNGIRLEAGIPVRRLLQ